MHIEFLVEDSSGCALLEILVPKLIGTRGESHTWRLHAYKGLARLPKPGGLSKTDPAKRQLLDRLPNLLRGLGKTPGFDAIVVVLDADKLNCVAFLAELRQVAKDCGVADRTLFRLAIEEIEAWYLGDRAALMAAYPRANQKRLADYRQDSVCGTWEWLADAVVKGGAPAAKRGHGPNAGDLKHEWARAIGPRMAPENNASPSFAKFRDGLRRISDRTNPGT